MKSTGKDMLRLAAIFAVYGGVVLAVFAYLGTDLGMTVSVMVGVAIPTLVALESYRRLQTLTQLLADQSMAHYRQLEALQSMYAFLDFTALLPPMRDWVISPDFATILISEILENKPKTIVEASSGLSTLVSAYCLKKQGAGQVISLDHDRKYAGVSQANVVKHGLDNLAIVHHAPLISHTIDGRDWQWYDFSSLGDIDEIDMLIIDGPPKDVQALSRYPALPLLLKRMSATAIILLDDAGRKDEREIVARWLREFPEFDEEFVETEKGAAILRRRSAAQ